jgi:hypothetical protein
VFRHKFHAPPVPFFQCVVGVVVVLVLALNSHAQGRLTTLKFAREQKRLVGKASNVFEDDEIKIVIPSGWKLVRLEDGVGDFPLTGVSIPYGKNGVALAKQGYMLALKHSAGHSSPIGRFEEVFRMPWLPDVADEAGCERYLGAYPHPVSRRLIFISLTFDIDNQEGLNACDFPRSGGPTRWFAGYFSVAKGAVFFDSEGPACAEKVYTLTTRAHTPTELPVADDPVLKKIISEAIEIVATIEYKRCPPAREK